ncbi:hypothetical protein AN958_06519 [Leucoagaricus sp. SymC.cos]|nr:hypothetical protein AN958_06519 [Leucoagaricus sp. SymC.cos]
MQLKFFFFLASIISIALAATNSQDILAGVSNVRAKVVSLHKSVATFPQTGRIITNVYAIHSRVCEVLDAMELATKIAKGLDGKLKFVFYLPSIISIALAATNSRDVLAGVSNVRAKVVTLHKSVASFSQTGRIITDVYAIHSRVNEVLDAMELATKIAKGLDGKVETETGYQVLDSFHQLTPLIEAACKDIVLKFFFFLASIISIALAATNSQDILAGVSNVRAKVVSLHKSVATFPQTGRIITNVYAIHSRVCEVLDAMELATKIAKGLDGKVETETGYQVLDSFHQLTPLVEAACKDIVVRDILMSIGQRAVAVTKLDILYLKQAFIELEDAALSHVPLDCIEETRGLSDQVKAALDTAITNFD